MMFGNFGGGWPHPPKHLSFLGGTKKNLKNKNRPAHNGINMKHLQDAKQSVFFSRHQHVLFVQCILVGRRSVRSRLCMSRLADVSIPSQKKPSFHQHPIKKLNHHHLYSLSIPVSWLWSAPRSSRQWIESHTRSLCFVVIY